MSPRPPTNRGSRSAFSLHSLGRRSGLRPTSRFCAKSDSDQRTVIASSAQPVPMLRAAAFDRVERQYLMGVRAMRPETRHKFFALYDQAVCR